MPFPSNWKEHFPGEASLWNIEEARDRERELLALKKAREEDEKNAPDLQSMNH